MEDVLVPHIILPEQETDGRQKIATGEQALLYACFTQAMRDLSDSVRLEIHHRERASYLRWNMPNGKGPQIDSMVREALRSEALAVRHYHVGRETIDWVKSERTDWQYAFEIVCFWVGASASRLRPVVVEAHARRDVKQLAKFVEYAAKMEAAFHGGE